MGGNRWSRMAWWDGGLEKGCWAECRSILGGRGCPKAVPDKIVENGGFWSLVSQAVKAERSKVCEENDNDNDDDDNDDDDDEDDDDDDDDNDDASLYDMIRKVRWL